MITSLILFFPPHLPAAIVANAMGPPPSFLHNNGVQMEEDKKTMRDQGDDKHEKQVWFFAPWILLAAGACNVAFDYSGLVALQCAGNRSSTRF